MADETQATPTIQEQPIVQAQEVDLTGGLENGAEVHNVVGTPTGEIIVHEFDEAGNIIGWHKEAKK